MPMLLARCKPDDVAWTNLLCAKAIAKVFIGVSVSMVVGVPIASVIANAVSIEMAMIFFAVVNTLAFIATLLFVPSMPVREKLSYGTQVSVLKKSMTWLSIAAVIFLNGAVFGVYSYFAEYLKTVTNTSSKIQFTHFSAYSTKQSNKNGALSTTVCAT